MQALRHLLVFLVVLMLASPVLGHSAMGADCQEPSQSAHTAVIHSDMPSLDDICCIASACQICAPGQAVVAFDFAPPAFAPHYRFGPAQAGPAIAPEPADHPPRRT